MNLFLSKQTKITSLSKHLKSTDYKYINTHIQTNKHNIQTNKHTHTENTYTPSYTETPYIQTFTLTQIPKNKYKYSQAIIHTHTNSQTITYKFTIRI